MMHKIIFRIIQFFIKIGVRMIQWHTDEIISGTGVLTDLAKILKQKKFNKIFIITDSQIYSSGLCNNLITGLQQNQLNYVVFKDVVSNPTIESVERALDIFRQSNSDVIISIGGGSVLDTAKLVGARYTNSRKSLKQMRGYFRVTKSIPYLIAVPTTAGSGSEATIVGVVTNEITHEKYAIVSPKLIPNMVVLDPVITINLPAHITAYTGMDALTHAIECYIGRANTKETKRFSLEAIKKIWNNLEKSVNNPDNLNARKEMQEASYLAGAAFTKGFVGYIHALAHPLSGLYNTPHGLANAVLLPEVLKKYDKSINKDIHILYKELGYQEHLSVDEERIFLIEEIYRLNERIGIPKKIAEIEEKDLEVMIQRCIKEAHPMYPVPRILNKKAFREIYKEII